MTIRFATLLVAIVLSIAACSPAGAPVDDIADAPPAAVDGSADTSSGTPADAPVDDAPADAPGTVPAADDGAVVGFTGYRGAAFDQSSSACCSVDAMPVAFTARERSRETTISVPSRPPSFNEPSFIPAPSLSCSLRRNAPAAPARCAIR